MSNNIFIAFDNYKIATSIAKILISNGNNVVCIAKSSSELLNKLRYYSGGIIIKSHNFDGVFIDSVVDYIPEEFSIIVLGNSSCLTNISCSRVFKLALPLKKHELISFVEMFMCVENNYMPEKKKNESDESVIQEAKKMLIDKYLISEDEAYRYIQKKSMDTGKKMVEIAKIILEI